MSAPLRQDSGRRILGDDPQDGGGVDIEAALHRRRKKAMISLLSEFERNIEPHVDPGHDKAIQDFKRSCRERLNGLCWEAIELTKLRDGESLNDLAVDLAEKLAFDDNGGMKEP